MTRKRTRGNPKSQGLNRRCEELAEQLAEQPAEQLAAQLSAVYIRIAMKNVLFDAQHF
jgi:hypothetical protein